MNKAHKLVEILGTQRRAADLLGVSYEHYNRWISGKKPVPAYVGIVADFMERTPMNEWPASVRRPLGMEKA